MRILIAVPTFETIYPETFKSIYNLKNSPGDILDFNFVKGYDCARARNQIVDIGLKEHYDYIFMIDSDIIVPEDALINLLEFDDDLVLGAYPSKSDPSKIELFKSGVIGYQKENRFDKKLYYDEVINHYRYLINGGGFGCALIKSSIFNDHRLKKPYFYYMDYGNGQLLSEDLYFCTLLRNSGYSIYADLRVQCSHIGKEIYK